jgi:predicted phosphodiesterase
LTTFNKEVNGCVCINPGRTVRGTNLGTYALINVKANTDDDKENQNISSSVSVSFQKL